MPPAKARRHGPRQRYPQRIHARSTHTYPPKPSPRIISGFLQCICRALLDLRLSHGGRWSETLRLCARGRRRIRARRLAANLDIGLLLRAAFFLLRHWHRFSWRWRKPRAARARLWAKLMKPFAPHTHGHEHCVAPHPLSHLSRRPRRLQQRHAHLHRGDGGDPRPDPVAAHQRAPRLVPTECPHSRRHPDRWQRESGTTRAIDPWWLVMSSASRMDLCYVRLEPYPRSGGEGGMTRALPKLRMQEAAARTPGHPFRHPGGDRRQQVPAARRGADRHPQARQRRRAPIADRQAHPVSASAVADALAALTRSAAAANLLALAARARAKATRRGDFTGAGAGLLIRAEYQDDLRRLQAGRVGICLMPLCGAKNVADFLRTTKAAAPVSWSPEYGHDRGQKVISGHCLSPLGFDVISGALFATQA